MAKVISGAWYEYQDVTVRFFNSDFGVGTRGTLARKKRSYFNHSSYTFVKCRKKYTQKFTS